MKKIIPFILPVALIITAFSLQTMTQKKRPMLNHAALSVVNLQRSTAFYTDILQLEPIPEPFKDGKHSWFKIAEHSQLHIIEASSGLREHDKSTHLCFSVPSIEEMIERLQKNNIDYGNWIGNSKNPTIRPDGVKQIFLKDPDGYWIEVNNDHY